MKKVVKEEPRRFYRRVLPNWQGIVNSHLTQNQYTKVSAFLVHNSDWPGNRMRKHGYSTTGTNSTKCLGRDKNNECMQTTQGVNQYSASPPTKQNSSVNGDTTTLSWIASWFFSRVTHNFNTVSIKKLLKSNRIITKFNWKTMYERPARKSI